MAKRDLLIEIGAEELPAAALKALAAALGEGLAKGLGEAGVAHGATRTFATPRRIAARIAAVAEAAADRQVERRGPPLAQAFDEAGAPKPAALAFAKTCGVEVGALERLSTDKGTWLVYRGIERGQPLAALIEPIVQRAVAALPIPKRMRWGAGSAEFARPVHHVVALHGADVLPLNVLGLSADRITTGHRFHHPKPIRLANARGYERRLMAAHVIADFAERRAATRAAVESAARAAGATALITEDLLDEVTALVEWPVAVSGRFEERFLALPREVVIATVREHQRYFPLEDAGGRLTGGFVTVANIESRDPAKVREGNERVVRPRLADAAFFWDQDRKQPLDALAARLGTVTFQTRLGSYADKTARIATLAARIGAELGAAADAVARAAALAKADLMSGLVGEFPELQGTIGRYYAAAAGEPAAVAQAIEEHYRPRHAGDALPTGPVGGALALADKLDTLAGIFAIGERPSGTKDPFALRRAALGVLRILLEGGVDIDLKAFIEAAVAAQPVTRPETAHEVFEFMVERLRGLLAERDPAASAEMIDAVLAQRPRSPVDAERRLAALRRFTVLPDAAVLSALNKRIVNILRKNPPPAEASVRPEALALAEERTLHGALAALTGDIAAAVAGRDYGRGLELLAGLRAPVDAFFETVMVMDEDPAKRSNRLALLRDARDLLGAVADLSRLPG